ARESTGRRVVVCSEHAHSSIDKAVRLLGMELRKTPADDEFRLRPDALELEDAAAVVATVGTTSSASVDPVPEIADRCEAAGARPPLPVAEALGGAALLRPRGPPADDPRRRSARRALRELGAGRARLGGGRTAPLLARLLPARGERRRERGAPRARERDRRD